jgi:RNA polymerase primary sigma factor
LSTYAAWWIKQTIKGALANQSKTIRLSVHLLDKIFQMRLVSMQLSEEPVKVKNDNEVPAQYSSVSRKRRTFNL